MILVYLVRHGINDFTGKRLIGRMPGVHLNDAGRLEAEAVGKALHDRQIAAIYSSPLERAMETAAPLSQSLGLPIHPHQGLQEVDFGDWQGYSAGRMRRLKLFKAAQEKPSLVRFPGGESYLEAQDRMVNALIEIASNAAEGAAVACFSHCDVIRLAIASLIGMPIDSFNSLTADTGSISLLALGPKRNELLKLNWRPGEIA